MSSEDNAQNGATTASPTTMGSRDVLDSRDTEQLIKPSVSAAPVPAEQAEDLATKVFQFLSTATPGTLGGIAAGLAAVTYFILGQVGLVLIGAFAGVTLFISYEAKHPEVSRAVRGEKGYDFLDRLLETKAQTSAIKTEQDEDADSLALARSFDEFQPETREALNSLVDAVIRDYVDWWYGPIVPSDRSFPLSCRKVLTSFLISVSNRLSRKRPADAFVDFLTNTCSIIIVFFSEMTAAYASVPSDSTTTAADAIYNYLSSNTDTALSNLLNQRQQAGKFKLVAEDLLSFLDRSAYDCDPARVFLRQILASTILEGTLQSCSKAEWINGWIVYLLESGETDLSQAIDEAIQDQKAFADIDGNFGNISLSKGNRNSYEMDRARKKEMTHKKKLSKADEEMERAMEEMKKLNNMIAEAEKAKNSSNSQESQASELLDNALSTNRKDLDLQGNPSSDSEAIDKASGTLAAKTASPVGNTPSEQPPKKEEPVRSPITPKPSVDLSSQEPSPKSGQDAAHASRFTNFDQIVPPAREESEDEETRRPPPLTLHNAIVTILDDPGNDKGRLRVKPNWEYLVQVEPASSHHPGWMIMKSYTQFEVLHESLRRIAAISGANAFLEAHSTFVAWKLHNRESLRGEVERYMRAACSEKPLAESEAMKRFLEKGQETRMAAQRGFSFESMGKGMLDAVSSAPKGMFDSGKVVVGGVTGVLGNIGLGQRKSTISSVQEAPVSNTNGAARNRPLSLSALPRMETGSTAKSRDSMESNRSSIISTQPGKMPPMERRPSYQMDFEQDGLQPTSDRWDRKSISLASSRGNSRASSMAALRSPLRSPSDINLANMKLPPPPAEIPDDYDSPTGTRPSSDAYSRTDNGLLSPQTSFSSPSRSQASHHQERSSISEASSRRPRKQFPPLSEQETRVAVELLFAVINELYTLSSAWNIRRTLLTAAKTFLIRPGNPSLASIQTLVQDTVLEANTSDAGIASHLHKLRENSLPTEEERKAWPAELSADEKEELRVKARKLFIQSSVPAALMGIMGQSATGEALGRVFDCLQIEEVARGLFFGIMLQAVRVVTH
ncbi:putative PXA domain-containing protein [Seiridium unicorne]|uniref:PXA domain-containing protein n=1 Tax=Seiridium unicorne TaxID=138068 RepID=A0ABR2V3W7_9PEZI